MKLVVAPDDALKKKCRVVEGFDGSLVMLIEGMLDVMYTHGGVGLAAPQVGSDLRVIVVDPSAGEVSKSCVVMVNPEVESRSSLKELKTEGCLSLPDQSYWLSRPRQVRVRWIDPNDLTEHVASFDSYEARIILHEIDHLDGILISDIDSKTTFIER
jgi:peptide deformylase